MLISRKIPISDVTAPAFRSGGVYLMSILCVPFVISNPRNVLSVNTLPTRFPSTYNLKPLSYGIVIFR